MNEPKSKEPKKDAIIVSTDVLVHDPKSIEKLRKNGKTLVIPVTVFSQLKGLTERLDIGLDVKEVIATTEEILKSGDKSLIIFGSQNFKNLANLDKKVANHQVIETAVRLRKGNEYGHVEIVSREPTVRIMARELGFEANDYLSDRVEVPKYRLREVNVPSGIISKKENSFTLSDKDMEGINENDGVICYSDFNFDPKFNGQWTKSFAAIRKGSHFSIIPSDISAVGLTPYSLNGDGKNWYQYVALAQLLDSSIRLAIMQGGAGSGKTLLAIASAIEQRKQFHNIIVIRPMIHLEDEDRMGFLPGNEAEKMSPWLRPITQALDLLKNIEGSGNKKLIENLVEVKKIQFESLDYIRGSTYFKTFIIIDEAQNLTPHQAKTIVTRAGEGTKFVLTGDLGQIDRRKRLDEKSSGLAYTIAKMKDHPSVGVTTFKETVRSPLAKLAEERM